VFSLRILAPIVRRKPENDNDDEERSTSIAGFRAAYVFDFSQTDGQRVSVHPPNFYPVDLSFMDFATYKTAETAKSSRRLHNSKCQRKHTVDTLNPQPGVASPANSQAAQHPISPIIPIQPFVKPAFVQGGLLPVSPSLTARVGGKCQ